MKKEEKCTPHIIAAAAFVVFVVLGLACASAPPGKQVISDYQTSGVPLEDHARIYIDSKVQVIGVDGDMSPSKYIAGGGNIILLASGEHTLNINTYDTYGDEPRYPGYAMTFTVEAGKYYRISTTGPRVGRLYNNTAFYFMDLDDPSAEFRGEPSVGGSGDEHIRMVGNRINSIKTLIDTEFDAFIASQNK